MKRNLKREEDAYSSQLTVCLKLETAKITNAAETCGFVSLLPGEQPQNMKVNIIYNMWFCLISLHTTELHVAIISLLMRYEGGFVFYCHSIMLFLSTV